MSTTDLRSAQRAVTSGAKEPQGSDNHIPCHLAPLQEAGQSSSLPTRLPRALRALAYEAVPPRTALTLWARLGGWCLLALALIRL